MVRACWVVSQPQLTLRATDGFELNCARAYALV